MFKTVLEVAQEWHSGIFSELYSLLSTHKIFGPMQRELLIEELKECLPYALEKEDRIKICFAIVFIWTAPERTKLTNAKATACGKFLN